MVLDIVLKGHSIKDKLITLIEESTFIDKADMGIPENWHEQALWK
jgi:hypothetical protein